MVSARQTEGFRQIKSPPCVICIGKEFRASHEALQIRQRNLFRRAVRQWATLAAQKPHGLGKVRLA